MERFTGLRQNVLRDYASRWVNAFPRVRRIALHQYHGHEEPPAKYRYAVIFELELETEVQEKQEDGSLKVSSEAFDIFAYDYFDDDRFKTVYNYENIDPHYKNEWFFFPKYSNEKWPNFAPKKPCWQLFPIESIEVAKACDNTTSIASQQLESQEKPAKERETPEQRATVNFLTRKNGDYWHIGFEGKEATVKYLDGLLYIAYLLQRPGESISCRELYQAVSGKTPDKIMSEGAVIEEGLTTGHRLQAFSDPKAKCDYAIKYQNLQNDLEKAESEMERQEIEKEMDALLPFLTEKAFPDKDTKRSQSNIRKRLDKAYAAIGKKGMKEMEKHLRDNIKTDGNYGLIYLGTADWDIDLG